MFRKPKSKAVQRQRVSNWDENEEVAEDQKEAAGTQPVVKAAFQREEEEEDPPVSTKPPSLLSFDDDEGADVNFEIKKCKRYLKEQRRLKKFEERAAFEESIKKEVEEEEEIKAKASKEKKAGKQPKFEPVEVTSEEEKEEDTTRVVNLSKSEVGRMIKKRYVKGTEEREKSHFAGGIPDSRAVYEAKKRRERMRREGGDFIPLDDDKKLRKKGERGRLIREDDNDDSDEDSAKFYSRAANLRNEEEKRREDELDFLQQQERNSPDEEADQWERQQIRKAVSSRTIGELRMEYNQSSVMFRGYEDLDDKADVGMDIDVDEEDLHAYTQPNQHANNNFVNSSGVVGPSTMADVLRRLNLRLQSRQEALNFRRSEVENMQRHTEENNQAQQRLREDAPRIQAKYVMLQRLKVYSACLLDCLQEKVLEVNRLSDEKRALLKSRKERLIRRRRRDMRDAYEECAAAAAGRSGRTGEQAVRAAEREARRARRRRQREGQLSGIGHEEGLSSDDEEAPSQMLATQGELAKLNDSLSVIFLDTHEEYASLKAVLNRVLEWLGTDEKSFSDAYVTLCLPKLASPYVRQQLAALQILSGKVRLDEMEWYYDALTAGEKVEGLAGKEHPLVVTVIPMIVEKVVLPFLIDVVEEEWDPLSLTACHAFSTLLRTLISETPTLTPKSKPLRKLLEAIIRKFNESVDEDLFVPMYAKQALENTSTGCRAFLERQFWMSIKQAAVSASLQLLRCVSAFSSVLSQETISSLLLSATSRVSALCLQQLYPPTVCPAAKALLSEIGSCLRDCTVPQARGIRVALSKVQAVVQGINKEVGRDVRKAIEILEEKNS